MKRIIGERLRYARLLALFSGLLCHWAILHMVFLLAWVSYVPLFISVFEKKRKDLIIHYFLFGAGIAIPSFLWIIPVFETYTGTGSGAGLMVYFLATTLFATYWILPGWIISLLQMPLKRKWQSILLNAFIYAALMNFAEITLKSILPGMPWFHYESGTGLLGSYYAVQHAALFGIPGISFFLLLVNYLLAFFLHQRLWRNLLITFLLIPSYLFLGYLILQFSELNSSSKRVKIALISGNTAPETKWDDNYGRKTVTTLFNLEKDALTLKPALMVWTESTIPWTYRKDDDFIREIIRISAAGNVNQILGMNTDYSETRVYNSVYSLSPDGNILGRYDKRFLLDFIERPVSTYTIPFLSGDGACVQQGKSNQPLITTAGKAGIVICNEGVLENPSADMVRNGAEFILNLSNDGWFRNTYLVDLHFFQLRVRAVENRKDIVVSSNDGISGWIDAQGRIQTMNPGSTPRVKLVNITPNQIKTHSGLLRQIFLLFCLFPVILALFIKIRKHYNE